MSRLIRRRAAAEVLERRYRRLLACYPPAYRAANAEEMLGVALAGSSAGRRTPEFGEAVSLIASGIGKRVGGTRTGYHDLAWQEAGAVLTIVGSIVLATFSTRDVVTGMSRIWVPELTWGLSWPELASALGWAMVAGVAIRGQWRGRGWRTVAATGACLCAAVQAVTLTQIYAVSSAWQR
jgi:hypothetical protein